MTTYTQGGASNSNPAEKSNRGRPDRGIRDGKGRGGGGGGEGGEKVEGMVVRGGGGGGEREKFRGGERV